KEAQRKLLFRNDGGGKFKEVGRTSGPGFSVEAVGRTLVAGDVDNDGAVDLLVTNNGGAAEVLHNSGSGNNPIVLTLVRTHSYRPEAGRVRERSERGRCPGGDPPRIPGATPGGEGWLELSRSERAARARRPGPSHARRPRRAPLAVRRDGNDRQPSSQHA